MFEDSLLNRSLPNDRVMITRHARPSLASQAASVNRTNDINSSLDDRNRIIISVIVSITLSRARRAISRCRR